MNNLESILKNGMHKPLWDFYIQTNHLISAKWTDLVLIKKQQQQKKKNKTNRILNFTTLADHGVN